jgi:hypothetical protein
MRQNGLEGSCEPLGSDPTLSHHYVRVLTCSGLLREVRCP